MVVFKDLIDINDFALQISRKLLASNIPGDIINLNQCSNEPEIRTVIWFFDNYAIVYIEQNSKEIAYAIWKDELDNFMR